MPDTAVDALENARRYQDLLEEVACAQCGGTDVDVVYPARYDAARPDDIIRAYRSSGDEILIDRLVRCRRCGLQYLDPRVRRDIVVRAYQEGTDETFVSQAGAREATFAPYLPAIEALLGRRGRILDVGTAGGSFLAVARRRGWDVLGCEPNRWLCDWARDHYGIEVRAGLVEDLRLPDRSVDVVTLWDVLEHTTDPVATLRECRRVLKDDGVLVVNVPDSDSLVARLMGRRWVFLLSVHLYYFTGSSLERMLRKTGFTPVRRRRHWQRLELGYVAMRASAYVPGVGRLASWMIRALGLSRVTIPYWLGQTNVMARAADPRTG